ncbi:MAG: YifB family Mg chelatase-like AAA ATPase [Clostridium sp.]
MSTKILGATYNGIDGVEIEVEVSILKGLPSFTIVGLADTSVKESKERVRSALVSMGYKFPLGRIIVNLAPANIRKVGSLLDLPIAIAILMESKQIKRQEYKNVVFLGELSLSGELKRVKGVLPIIINGENKTYIVPKRNYKECYFIKDKEVLPMSHISEVTYYINYNEYIKEQVNFNNYEMDEEINYDEVIGHDECKRIMTISAAGMHNVVLYGTPGCGKSLLANAMKSILPVLSEKEKIEVAKIYSAYGDDIEWGNIHRPFRTPHQSITRSALIGGGRDIKPGEISLAHNGVLFLDEILEFKKEVLDSLRQPLEDGVVKVDRLSGRLKLPCKFLLIGAFNPCPCGKNSIDPKESKLCTCTFSEKKRYQNRLSKALRDRIDMYCYVPRVDREDIMNNKDSGNVTKMMKAKVKKAINMQTQRYKGTIYSYNSELKGKELYKYIKLDQKCKKILTNFYEENDISLRGYEKIIKISRTIADIEGEEEIFEGHIYEALTYRKNINGELL